MNITLGLVAFFTILAWLLVAYIVYQTWDRRRKHKHKPNQVIGIINSITMTDNGIEVEGTLNDEGKRLEKAGEMTGLSVGFKPQESSFVNGVRRIEKAELMYVSLDHEPGPYGGNIDYVGTQPDGD